MLHLTLDLLILATNLHESNCLYEIQIVISQYNTPIGIFRIKKEEKKRKNDESIFRTPNLFKIHSKIYFKVQPKVQNYWTPYIIMCCYAQNLVIVEPFFFGMKQ